MLIIVIFPLLIILSLSQRVASNYPLIHNSIHKNQQIMIKYWIKEGEQILYEQEIDLLYSDQQPQIINNFTVDASNLSNNLTLCASLFVFNPHPLEIAYEERNLTRFQKIRKVEDNQFHGSSYDLIDQVMPQQTNNQVNETVKYAMHIANKFNIMFIYTQMTFPNKKQIQPQMNLKLQTDFSYTTGIDLSQLHIPFKTYSQTGSQNHTISISIKPYDLLYYMAFYSISHPQFMSSQSGLIGQLVSLGLDQNAMDQMKQILFTNHIFLLIAYFTLSSIQTILKLFTIKQEYTFWKNIQSNPGMSLKTLFFQLGAQVIITLYLIEHDSTKLVIFFGFLDMAIIIWKITRTYTIKLKKTFPFISLQANQLYKKREKMDSQAIWYMNYLLFPLFVLYFTYSLYSKGWVIKSLYTFLLQNAVAFVAIFGFIMMTPQLYLNYKLKSVQHLNWRGLIYRFINTILDDLFAFMVTLPMLRRLMYFRDDIIFIIYIYQRWIYRVDYTRKTIETINEPTKQQLKTD